MLYISDKMISDFIKCRFKMKDTFYCYSKYQKDSQVVQRKCEIEI